jgi:hypothetical protein
MNALAEIERPLNRALSAKLLRDSKAVPHTPFEGVPNFSPAIHRRGAL